MTLNDIGVSSLFSLLQAAYKSACVFFQDRMRFLRRYGWAVAFDPEVEESGGFIGDLLEYSDKSIKTTLSSALKSAGTVVVDGFMIDTQIDGNMIGKPGQIMLTCSAFCGVHYTVILHDEEIEIDAFGTAMVTRLASEGDGDEIPKVAVTFMNLDQLEESFFLRSEGVPA
ncbi:hypothetical protein [Rhodoferax antarcticus]|uniref:Uncharacterized protein n=1 Tax=Rhodoferax antarcticus ANT.BR TaxID=1111071 RepID=A0A1Q8Y925_9BURK|nr:hypothetical protein [Rhodoferax antarcticus]OLP04484.1 hypothetical protein BLL52_4118 [Rhodoferax antarcticus ANT.BR]